MLMFALKPPPRDSKSAFTLVELLTVMVVVSVVLGLILPALLSSRESARRINCMNLFRQIGLATANFESSSGGMPAGGYVAAATVPPHPDSLYFNPQSGTQSSWMVELLPFMEEVSIFSQFDFSLPMTQQSHDPQATMIGSLICTAEDYPMSEFVHEGKSFAKASVAGFASPYRLESMIQWPGALGGGRLGRRVGQSLASFLDGPSKTLLAAEVRTLPSDRDQRGVWSLPWVGSSLLAANAPHIEHLPSETDLFDVDYVPSDESAHLVEVQTPNKQSGEAFDRLYYCEAELSVQSEMPCTQTSDGLGLYASPRSLHAGGVTTVYVDGHCEFLADGVDPVVYVRLIAIEDGQLIKE